MYPEGYYLSMARSTKYQDRLIEKLKDHDEAVAYLNAALEESLKGDGESKKRLGVCCFTQ